MLCFKTKPSSVLVLITLILAALFFFSSAEAVEEDGVQRSALENGGNSTLILAKERTRRRNPLDNYNYYTGGWNIRNSSYFDSVLYTTGTPYFYTAYLWFVGFAIFLVLVQIYMICFQKRKYGYFRSAYAPSLILLYLFTTGAAIGSVVHYTGQIKFRETTRETLSFVSDQANSVVSNLTDVSNYLTNAKTLGVNNVFLPPNVQNSIDNVNNVISGAANTLHKATEDNKDFIFEKLDFVKTFRLILGAVMLFLTLLGLCNPSWYKLVIVCWIYVSVALILCGVSVVLNNVVGDTCVAMDDWVKHPTVNTMLDSIIPCVDPRASQEALNQSKDVTYEMARLVNGIILNVSNANAGPLHYNQSGPLVPLLCNPYNPDKTDRACAAGEVHLDNATEVWRNYRCNVSGSNICTTVGRLTPSLYDQMSSAVNLSSGLYRYGPFLTDLVECTFVRDTFTKIHDDYCPDGKLYSLCGYFGLLLVLGAVCMGGSVYKTGKDFDLQQFFILIFSFSIFYIGNFIVLGIIFVFLFFYYI